MSTTAPTLIPPLPALAQEDPAQLPSMPRVSVSDPSTTDLVAFAAWLKSLASNCDVGAAPRQPRNPFATIGALVVGTDMLHRWLAARLADEERNLLLMDRLRHEEQQERAHELLMATDDEYADEFEGEDDIP